MPTFISSTGNPEVWARKPKGYMTPEEWSKAHPAPEPTPPTDEELAEQRRQEILVELNALDSKSARPARAIALAQISDETPNSVDVLKLTEFETMAKELREELAALNA